jgi:hypothetical protein
MLGWSAHVRLCPFNIVWLRWLASGAMAIKYVCPASCSWLWVEKEVKLLLWCVSVRRSQVVGLRHRHGVRVLTRPYASTVLRAANQWPAQQPQRWRSSSSRNSYSSCLSQQFPKQNMKHDAAARLSKRVLASTGVELHCLLGGLVGGILQLEQRAMLEFGCTRFWLSEKGASRASNALLCPSRHIFPSCIEHAQKVDSSTACPARAGVESACWDVQGCV